MNEQIPLVVHATREAAAGAFLGGLLSACSYREQVQRTVLAGFLTAEDRAGLDQLTRPGGELALQYWPARNIYNGVSPAQREALIRVERTYQVELLYGTRSVGDGAYEVLLVDASRAGRQEVDSFKYYLWEALGIDSLRLEQWPDYQAALAAAVALWAGLQAIRAGAGLGLNQKIMIAHDWQSLPLVFAARRAEPDGWRTVYYAQETPIARRLVEERSGHDTAFYNVLFKARSWHVDLQTVYGSQVNDHRQALLRQAARLDLVLAVGDLVAEELRFLDGRFRQARSEVVYRGTPVMLRSPAEKEEARERIQHYCASLLGFVPDYIFTHVAPPTLAHAFWRDMRVLDRLDWLLRGEGRRAVYLAVTGEWGSAPPPEMLAWPAPARGNPDNLGGLEAPLYADVVAPFNARATNISAVLINRASENQGLSAGRQPTDSWSNDVRLASDLEFGQSIYEPFGTGQMSALAGGSLICLTNICGCLGLVDQLFSDQPGLANCVVVDYVSLPRGYWLGSPYDGLAIDQSVRDWNEIHSSQPAALTIFQGLPRSRDDRRRRLERGQAAAASMDWETVVRDRVMPALRRICTL